MSYKCNLKYITELNDQFRYYKSIESLFELDQWSALPLSGGGYRQRIAAYIAAKKGELYQSQEAHHAAKYFKSVVLSDIDDLIERGLIRTFMTRYRNAARMPADLICKYNMLRTDVMNHWKEARAAKDYQIFQPWLEQVFNLKKEIALAVEPEISAFDTIVDMTDSGLRCDEINREFDVLKKGIKALLERIKSSSGYAEAELLSHEENEKAMTEFACRLAKEIGYDPDKGRFNHDVVHGFTSFLGPNDARISTQRSGSIHLIFTCLHEAGHAMYATGGSDEVNTANMWGGIEGGFHEANARFYENMVGRSEAYWNHYYPQLQRAFSSFSGVAESVFYRALHAVRPSLRRIEADEVTYSLHSILRYELERDYFNGVIHAEDMADCWNDKYEEYLGLRPKNDTEGILQDMHWAGDYIGYFQSYALGNIYDGQILESLKRDIPDYESEIAKGDFNKLNDWMKINIHSFGCCLTSGELAERLSGRRLDAAPFLCYLENKYSKIYGLQK